MIRFLSYLFGWKDYEDCKSCNVLREQLKIVNEEKKELTQTLIKLFKPEPVVAQANPVVLQPIANTAGLWSKRRAALEEADRQKLRASQDKVFAGKPDVTESIDKLERELGIDYKEMG